jgi:tetratricopeptide (TPR) repeat protein
MLADLGTPHRVHAPDLLAGREPLLEGDASAAERSLRGAYDGLRTLGLGIDAAQAAALLARALLAQGRAAEAEALSQESEALAGDDLQAAIAWRGARAEALAQRGEHEAAIELARAAVEIATATDALLDHADARLSLAAALRAAGRSREAEAEDRQARELWETKGASLLAERAGRQEAPTSTAAATTAESPARARRLRENAASRAVARFAPTFESGDDAAIQDLMSEGLEVIHHATGTSYGREEHLESLRRNWRQDEARLALEPLATLGDELALSLRTIGSRRAGRGRFDVGEWEHSEPALHEVDASGRCVRIELFGPGHLHAAVVRLFECHAERQPPGPARERAAQKARSLAVFERAIDPDRVATSLAPTLEVDDRRSVGTGRLHGPDELLHSLQTLMGLSEGFGCRFDDLLGVSEDALLVHMTSFGTHRESGGAYERPILELWAFDDEGLIRRWERFDPGHESQALARYEALVGTGADEPFANAASRAERQFVDAFNAKDWEAILATVAEQVDFDERRRLSRNRAERGVWLDQLRVMFDLPESRFSTRLLATRGERLSLHLHGFDAHVAEGGGPLAMETHPALHEVDAHGRIVAILLFDADDQGAAYAELDRRYEAGEAAAAAETLRAFREGFAERRWEDLLAVFAPGFVDRDHRSIALLGTRHGGEAKWVGHQIDADVDRQIAAAR